jgi:hypothetical protein
VNRLNDLVVRLCGTAIDIAPPRRAGAMPPNGCLRAPVTAPLEMRTQGYLFAPVRATEKCSFCREKTGKSMPLDRCFRSAPKLPDRLTQQGLIASRRTSS